MRTKVVVGSRGSKLALIQAGAVVARIKELDPEPDVEICRVVTMGDRNRYARLDLMDGVGLFVKELEEALLDGRIDLAVHLAQLSRECEILAGRPVVDGAVYCAYRSPPALQERKQGQIGRIGFPGFPISLRGARIVACGFLVPACFVPLSEVGQVDRRRLFFRLPSPVGPVYLLDTDGNAVAYFTDLEQIEEIVRRDVAEEPLRTGK